MKWLMLFASFAIVFATALLITPTLAETVMLGGEESLPLATPWYGHWWVWVLGVSGIAITVAFVLLAMFQPRQRSSSFGEDL